MRRLAAAVLALSLAAALPAAADEPASFDDLVAALRDDDPARRDAAEAEIERRGEAVRGDVERALAAEKDPEARTRLARVLPRLLKLAWEETLEAGRARAEKDGRLLLVVRGDGPRGTPATLEGKRLREALEDTAVQDALHGFAGVWIAEDALAGNPVNSDAVARAPEGHGATEVYVLHPVRGLVHYLRGWWQAERLAAELRRARDFAAAETLDAVRTLRAAAFEELVAAFRESGCANARRHLMPWRCAAEGCVLRRLGLCYRQGDALLGGTLKDGLPGAIEGGEGAALPF